MTKFPTSLLIIFSRMLHPTLFIDQLVGWSHFTFFMIFFLWPYYSCPNGPVTSNVAPAHQPVTGVAVYPALFCYKAPEIRINKKYYCSGKRNKNSKNNNLKKKRSWRPLVGAIWKKKVSSFLAVNIKKMYFPSKRK